MSKLKTARGLCLLKVGAPSLMAATFWVTDYCNSRCKMCHIWKKGDKKQMDLETFDRVFRESKTLKSSSVFAFTGGEPFLKDDLVGFVSVVSKHAPNSEVRIVTNGTLTDKIKKDVLSMMGLPIRLTIKVSIDGNENTHDKIRGVKGTYRKVIKTIIQLVSVRKEFPKKLDIVIGFTATTENYKEILDVFQHSKTLGVGFFYKPAVRMKRLENTDVDGGVFLGKEYLECLKEIHESLKEGLNNRPYTERVTYGLFYDYVERYIESPKRVVPCQALSASVHIDSNWDVFSCADLRVVVGNLIEKPFDDVWNDSKRIRVGLKTADCGCICTGDSIPSILVHNFPLGLIKL